MAEKDTAKNKSGQGTEVRVFAKDAVNQTTTLPSAETPAKPPSGKKPAAGGSGSTGPGGKK